MTVKNQFVKSILNKAENCLKYLKQKCKPSEELNEEQLKIFKLKIERMKSVCLTWIENYNITTELREIQWKTIQEMENGTFGKSGYLEKLLDEFGKVPTNRKEEFGILLNEFKNDVQQKLNELKSKT